jgi:hypothetical protein
MARNKATVHLPLYQPGSFVLYRVSGFRILASIDFEWTFDALDEDHESSRVYLASAKLDKYALSAAFGGWFLSYTSSSSQILARSTRHRSWTIPTSP